MIQITLDTLVISDTPALENYSVTDDGIEGLEWTETRTSAFDIPRRDGQFINQHLRGGRVVSIPIRVRADNPEDYRLNREALIGVLTPQQDNGKPLFRHARFVLDDGSVRVLRYVGGNLRLPYRHQNYAEGAIVLMCPDPSLFGDSVTGNAILSEGGGFDIASRYQPNTMSVLLRSNSEYVEVAQSGGELSGFTDFSFSFWFKKLSSDTTGTKYFVRAKSGADHSPPFQVRRASANINFQVFNGAGTSQTRSLAEPADTNWHHVAGTFSSTGDLILYVDGVASASLTVTIGTMKASTDPMYIGVDNRTGTPADGIPAYYDQFRMFNRVLTPAEVTTLFEEDFSPTDDLRLQLLFDSNTPTGQARDSSGNNLHGTVVGGAITTIIPDIYTDGGFDISFDIEATVGGSVVINNAGDAITYPVITLRGPLSSPTMTNQTTGKSLTLGDLDLGAGQSVVVDMKNRTIKQGDENLFAKKSPTTDFWYLETGNNTILFTDTVYNPQALMTISYRSAWSGA
jgi:hypothetical protein